MTRITSLTTHDLRFPTSASLDGSDAMNPDPDYSAAYVVLSTDGVHQGHGLTFTIGRGNDIVCNAIEALTPRVVGLELSWIAADPGRFWRHVTSDSQLRWIGSRPSTTCRSGRMPAASACASTCSTCR